MTYAPSARPHGYLARRRNFSVHPGLLAAAVIFVIYAALVVSVLVNGVPQLDPQAQMFVVP
jgi:hypothetical protein